MSKYIDAEKLIAEIERRLKIVEPHKDTFESAAACRQELIWMKNFITSLQQEQPDKYETALEKARDWMPNVNQGGHAILIDIFPELGEGLDPRYGGRKQEQPMPDSTKLIELWHEDKEMLKEKDFRNDPWRLAYNAFMCGFGRGLAVKQEQQECSSSFVDVDAVREDFITEVYRVLDADPTNDRANAIINAFDSLPTVSQEQPEVELWKEIHRYFNPHGMELQFDRSKGNTILKPEQLIDFARHFWNKGYNARKEE